MRFLGVLRLSVDSETSVSIRKQREIISSWAQVHDHEIIGWAEDSGVSGDLDPFSRPSLGAWLTEEKVQEYDGLVAMKLDRVSRRVVHFGELRDWLDHRDKVIVGVSDGIDTSTIAGQFMAGLLSVFAENELSTIKERNRTTKAQLRTTVRFAGGKVPYGYRVVPAPDGKGRILTVDDEAAAVVRDMVESILVGQSASSIRNRLTVPAPIDHERIRRGEEPKGVEWSTRAILTILRSPALLGQKVHKGRPVPGPDGLPLQMAAPIISYETWDRLQQALNEAVRPHVARNATWLLADLVVCAGCGGKLYKQIQRRSNGMTNEYARCSNRNNGRKCPAPVGRKAAPLEDAFIGSFKKSMGHQIRYERIWVPGEDHTAELAQVERAIAGVREEVDLGLEEVDRPGYIARMKRLMERRKHLEALPNRPGHWEYQGTGQTMWEAWQATDDAGRRQLLLGAGVVAVVDNKGLRWATREAVN